MRIVTPKGVIRGIEVVVPVTEKRLMFNGEQRRFVDKAKDMSVCPTALALRFSFGTLSEFGGSTELFIGNLSPSQVKEIQQSLTKDGFFDFSGFEYQKARLLDKTVFDEGASNPYTSEITRDIVSYFTNFASPMGMMGGSCMMGGDLFSPNLQTTSIEDDADWDYVGEDCEDTEDEDGEDTEEEGEF